MTSNNPNHSNHPQLKEVFENEINTSSHQNNQEDLKDETKHQISGANPSLTFGNIQTTTNSLQENIQQDPLNNSNTIIFSPGIQNNLVPKMSQKYSFSKDYFDEVYQNLLFDELRFYQMINPNYMNMQNDICDKMRSILVDWLIDIHNKLNLHKKTLYQCVFIIDAYLSKIIIGRKNLQLLGLAALLIAYKGNEIIYPRLQSFIELSDNAYTLQELKDMEIKVIQKLDCDILAPTADEFFSINSDFFEFTEIQKYFGEYFLDSSLVDNNLLKYKQSTIAVACCYIVIKFFNLNGAHLIVENTNQDVKPTDVKDCARDLCFLVKNMWNSSLGATKNKYMSDKYLNVAQLCENKL